MQMHSTLYEHFKKSGHSVFLKDVSVMLNDKAGWIHILKTKALLGLNSEKGLQI